MEHWLSIVIGILLGFICTYFAIKVFPRLNLLDYPERYGLNRPKLPYPGGIIFCILITSFFIFTPHFWWLILPILLLGIVSFWDDKKPLPASLRLSIHLLIASFLVWKGLKIEFVSNPFIPGESFDLSSFTIISSLLTVLWIIVIQNAMNWFDGLKGLSVGISGIGFLTLGLYGLFSSDLLWETSVTDFLSLTLYTSGICFGAFIFFLRGKIILGDSGSQVLGLLLAILSIFAGTKIGVTLLVLGFPLLDSIFVVFRRIFLEKKSPFAGDKKHLHHNLANYLGEKKATLILLGLSSLLGLIAIFAERIEKIISLGILILAILILNIWLTKKQK